MGSNLFLKRAFLLCCLAGQSACVSMLFGTAAVKSDDYVWPAPPESWEKIDPGSADLAFQHHGDRATISLNSVCDQYQDQTLEELSKSLMLGLADSKVDLVEPTQAAGLPGLRTTVSGKVAAVPIMVTLTVLRSSRCVYDFMLVARADAFAQHRQTYLDLIQGFQTKGEP